MVVQNYAIAKSYNSTLGEVPEVDKSIHSLLMAQKMLMSDEIPIACKLSITF